MVVQLSLESTVNKLIIIDFYKVKIVHVCAVLNGRGKFSRKEVDELV